MAAASGHTEANSPAQPKRPSWRGNRMKMHAGVAKNGLQPAGIRRQIPCRHRRDDHAGGETR
ncbi:MAG: hypothetical protein ACLR23_06220 [Clostridia bacterium]